MTRKPSDTYYATFPTQNASGAATNADSLPTATARRSGATDGAFTLTVTNMSAGIYRISGTIPSGYTAGDSVQIEVSATIGGVAAKQVIDSFVIDTKRASEVAADVWSSTVRSLTTFGTLASDTTTAVWANGTRSLTTFGTLVADVATAVWAAGARTLTAFGFTVNTNANATELGIKAKTDNLPASPASSQDMDAAESAILAQFAALPSLGTGPYAVTVQTNPVVVGAAVSLSQGIDTPRGNTGADGSITFNVANLGEYDLIAAAAGYLSYAGTVDVAGDESETITLTQVVIAPPANPLLCKPFGFFKYLNQDDAPVQFTFELIDGAAVNSGRMLVERRINFSADADGEIGTNDDNTLLIDRTDSMDVEGKEWKITCAPAGITGYVTAIETATFDLNSIPGLIAAED